MAVDLTNLTISRALRLFYLHELTATLLVEACLQQIDRLNPYLNAILTPMREQAYQAAQQADAFYRSSPPVMEEHLAGIPIALKDLIETAGVRTTAGSRFFLNYFPARDAQVVWRLKIAGASLIGKAHTHEIALGVTGTTSCFGPARNPWDTCRIPGGSSSGSAIAVATGMALAALGTDTGGSVRIPASLCGVVGLKPTFGRISKRGVMPLSAHLDHVGLLTRSVEDAALLLQVLAGYDPQDPASVNVVAGDYLTKLSSGVYGWRICCAVGEYIEVATHLRILEALEQVRRVFLRLGASVQDEDCSWLQDLAQANGRMVQADAAVFHRQRLQQRPNWFGEDVRQRLYSGSTLRVSDYIEARQVQLEGRRRLERFFENYEILMLPTTPIVAPPIRETDPVQAAALLTRFTSPFNLTGLPAISIPAGQIDGLPFGIQLVAAPWAEAQLLQAAFALEKSIFGGILPMPPLVSLAASAPAPASKQP